MHNSHIVTKEERLNKEENIGLFHAKIKAIIKKRKKSFPIWLLTMPNSFLFRAITGQEDVHTSVLWVYSYLTWPTQYHFPFFLWFLFFLGIRFKKGTKWTMYIILQSRHIFDPEYVLERLFLSISINFYMKVVRKEVVYEIILSSYLIVSGHWVFPSGFLLSWFYFPFFFCMENFIGCLLISLTDFSGIVIVFSSFV